MTACIRRKSEAIFINTLFTIRCLYWPAADHEGCICNRCYTRPGYQNIDAHKDATVRWGGVIIDVENDENFTLIQTLIYPLS